MTSTFLPVFLIFPPVEFKLHEAETLFCLVLNSQSLRIVLFKYSLNLHLNYLPNIFSLFHVFSLSLILKIISWNQGYDALGIFSLIKSKINTELSEWKMFTLEYLLKPSHYHWWYMSPALRNTVSSIGNRYQWQYMLGSSNGDTYQCESSDLGMQTSVTYSS